MGQSLSENTGSRVDALEPGEPSADRRPMLYSAEALRTVEAIREHIGLALKQRALDRAKRSCRDLVTDDDVWAALESLDMADIDSDFAEEADDEQ